MPVKLIDGALVRDFETTDDGGWGTVKGKYRLAMPAEIRSFGENERFALQKKHGNSARVEAEFIARYVVSWDVTTADGNPTDPADPENYVKLPLAVFTQFSPIIEGFTAAAVLGNSKPSSAS